MSKKVLWFVPLDSEMNGEIKRATSLTKIIKHQNILNCTDIFSNYNYTIFSFHHTQTLLSWFLKQPDMKEKIAAKITKHLLLGLSHLHSLGIVHGEVDIENVVYNPEKKSFQLNFSLSNNKYGGKFDICSILAPPECHHLGVYGKESDMWG